MEMTELATIRKRGNSYLLRVSVGYDTEGRQIEKRMTWTPPPGMSERAADKEAEREAFRFEEKVKKGQVPDGRMKFSNYAEAWFTNYAELQLRPRTVAGYRGLMKRINEELGYLYLDKIRPAHLMDFYQTLNETHKTCKCKCRINLKNAIRKKGMTLEQFASQAGISPVTLTSACQRMNVNRSSAEKIAAKLGMRVERVFADSAFDETLAASTISKYHRLLSSMLHTAVKWQLIPENPCDRVDPPKVRKVKIDYLDAEEAIHLLELLEDEPANYRAAVTILLYTGMRRGELLGLEWPNVNFKTRTVTINKSSLYLADRGIFQDETKNASSDRVIRVPEAAIEAFKEMKVWQAEQKLRLGTAWKESGKIFTALDGAPMHPDTLSSWFRKFIDRSDLPPIHLHSLRHTNATLNIANGIAVTTVAGQLGHVDATTTTKIYAHAIKSAQAAAADMMDELLAPKPKKKKRSTSKRLEKCR